jgi:SAM-dependent methyltransferase
VGECAPENFYDELKEEIHALIAKTVRQARTVVDLGCGSCDLAFFLAESNCQEVIGVDVSDADFPPQRRVARAEGAKVQCVKTDAAALTFLGPDSADAVVSLWALHEMSSPVAVLDEGKRVLRPGGVMLIVDFPRGSLAQDLWNEDYFSPQEVADMLRKAGFIAVRSRMLAGGQIMWAHGEKDRLYSQQERRRRHEGVDCN